MRELPKRRHPRLKNYDYGDSGDYFVTICTAEHKETLSSVVVGRGLAPAETKLTELGKTAEEQILKISERFPTVTVENYVIMPNHIHILIFIEGETGGASPSPTLDAVICAFKSLTVKNYKKLYPVNKIWQRSYYDHVIRNDVDYSKHWDYIENNPIDWALGRHKE